MRMMYGLRMMSFSCRNKTLLENWVSCKRLGRKIIPSALFLVLCDYKVCGGLSHLRPSHTEKIPERFNLVILTVTVEVNRRITIKRLTQPYICIGSDMALEQAFLSFFMRHSTRGN